MSAKYTGNGVVWAFIACKHFTRSGLAHRVGRALFAASVRMRAGCKRDANGMARLLLAPCSLPAGRQAVSEWREMMARQLMQVKLILGNILYTYLVGEIGLSEDGDDFD